MDAVPATVSEIEATAERRSTPCGDGRLTWRLWGAGPPLVLLHGDFGSWTHWLRNIPVLARHFRLLVPDMPGYGDSDTPPAPWSPFSLGELLAQGAAEILGGTARYDVAGFSFGGIIAGHLAAVAPESVRRLVLLGAGGLGLPAPGLPPLRRATAEMDAAERAAAHRHNLAACMIGDPARIDGLAVAIQAANVRRTRLRTGPIPASDALVRVLPRVRAPLFGIWGEHDAYARSDLAARAAALRAEHPELDFRVVPGAGHWTPYEAPETVNAALLEMLG